MMKNGKDFIDKCLKPIVKGINIIFVTILSTSVLAAFLAFAFPFHNFILDELQLKIDCIKTAQDLLTNNIGIVSSMGTIYFALLAVTIICGKNWEGKEVNWYIIHHIILGGVICSNIFLIAICNVLLNLYGKNYQKFLALITTINIYSALLLLFVVLVTITDLGHYFRKNNNTHSTEKSN